MEETTPGSSRVSVRNGDAQGSRVDGVMVSGLGGGAYACQTQNLLSNLQTVPAKRAKVKKRERAKLLRCVCTVESTVC